jgi:hypothetical protein
MNLVIDYLVTKEFLCVKLLNLTKYTAKFTVMLGIYEH